MRHDRFLRFPRAKAPGEIPADVHAYRSVRPDMMIELAIAITTYAALTAVMRYLEDE